MEIDKVYEPQRFEPHWAQWWVDRQLFRAEAKPGEPYFSLVIPPPNVTGSLHMGHMFQHSIIDAQVRWQRMRGVNTLWLPGTDHAGIATQIMVENQLKQEGLTRRDLGREQFEARVWQWKEQYGGRITEQMKRAGVSCDWSRERFTLDAGLSRAVREAFVRLYEKGLIYRGQYMVNWCPRCQTALSDLEVVHEETEGNLWYIRYPVNGSPMKLVVATTRPETMLGDTAVAINPRDPRAA
jgi:valyl-tRNA synthetase